jgi:hypothetical protein
LLPLLAAFALAVISGGCGSDSANGGSNIDGGQAQPDGSPAPGPDGASPADGSIADSASPIDAPADASSNLDGPGDGSGQDASFACPAYVDITAGVADAGVYHGTATGNVTDPSTCYGAAGPKAFLHYKAPAATNLRFTVTSDKPATDPTAKDAAVIVRSLCAGYTSELACNPSPATKPTYAGIDLDRNTLMFTGDVFIVVAGTYFDQGFSLALADANSCFGDPDCAAYENATCDSLTSVCDTVVSCPAGTGDCDGNPANGCETNVNTDSNNCGKCGVTCAGHANSTSGTCVSGVCQLACTPGYGNCDGIASDGCESTLATDPANCGACGKSCNGGVCNASTCGPAPVVLASEVGTIESIVIDATYAYYVDDSGFVMKVPLDGSAAATAIWTPTNQAGLWAMSIVGSVLYVTDSYDIYKLPTSGAGGLQSIGRSPDAIRGIVVDASGAYFGTDYNTYFLAPGSTTPTVVLANQAGHALSVGGGYYYFASGDLYRGAEPGGTPKDLAYDDGLRSAVSATAIFLVGGVVGSVPLAGGSPTSLTTNVWQTYDLALDLPNSMVYFTGGENDMTYGVYRVPMAGGQMTQLSALQSKLIASWGYSVGHLMAVDAKNVYWANGGSLMKLGK